MKKKAIALMLPPLFFTQMSFANNIWDDTTAFVENKANHLKVLVLSVKQPQQISFQELFPKPIYKKSYFGFVLTGATVVLGGAFLFITAPAGAPAALLGTAPIATWVGGGTAGSYMAGLSTIGSWFGGNAILGAAILNGISIGVAGGGVTKFATMTAIQKVGVLSSVTATALDGVALIEKPNTNSLNYQVRLMLPLGIGSKEVQEFAIGLQDIEEELQTADGKNDKVGYELWAKKKQALVEIGKKWVADAKKSNSVSSNDLIVYGIFSKNIGDSTWHNSLISRIIAKSDADTGYLDYLDVVAKIENGNLKEAEKLLYHAVNQNPYAIEPYILLVNLLGKDFKGREKDIQVLAKKAEKDFDPNKYETRYSLVSLFYRIGTLYLQHGKYAMANHYFDSALGQVSFLQNHLGGKQVVNLIQIGKANSLHGMRKGKKADLLYQQVLKDCKTAEQVDLIKGQYLGAL